MMFSEYEFVHMSWYTLQPTRAAIMNRRLADNVWLCDLWYDMFISCCFFLHFGLAILDSYFGWFGSLGNHPKNKRLSWKSQGFFVKILQPIVHQWMEVNQWDRRLFDMCVILETFRNCDSTRLYFFVYSKHKNLKLLILANLRKSLVALAGVSIVGFLNVTC